MTNEQTELTAKRRPLKIVRWGDPLEVEDGRQLIGIGLAPRPLEVLGSVATGEALVSNGLIGADVIRLEAGLGFEPHTHPGDHVLIALGGLGTITYGGEVRQTAPGHIYMVDGMVPHAVGAITDHVIMAIGSPHKALDNPERMVPTEYQAVVSDLGDLDCLICSRSARPPDKLHSLGCGHCPCRECAWGDPAP